MGFDFKGDTDSTWERTEEMTKEAMLCWVAELFAPNVPYSMPGQPKPFNYMNPPSRVKNLVCWPWCFVFISYWRRAVR